MVTIVHGPGAFCLLRTLKAAASRSATPAAGSNLARSSFGTTASGGRQWRWRRRALAAGAAESPAATSCSRHPMLLSQLAIPPEPGFRYLGARVEHVLAPRDGLLSELVSEALDLPEGAAALLLRFGAIHTCPVPPAMPPAVLAALPPEQAVQALADRQEALRRAGNSSQARTPQRATEDKVVPRHSYLRVHLHPKRFPAAYSVAWQDRIVADTPQFVVVSKPPGVPAAPTVDNLLECAPSCAAQAIGHPQSLLVTHRLDQCTEGLLVLGKARAFVAAFNELVKRSSGNSSGSSNCSGKGADRGGGAASSSSRGVDGSSSGDGSSRSGSGSMVVSSAEQGLARPLRKFYRAATSAPPPLGLLRHYLSMERRHAGLPTFTIAHERELEGSLVAELRVLEVQTISVSDQAARQLGAPREVHECVLELLTGRTHQIRAQLSAAGCPLLGDSLYAPLASPELRQRLYAGDVEGLADEGQHTSTNNCGRLLAEPAGGIGLQACRLECTDPCLGGSPERPAVFEAGVPWWRQS
ncbi:hypothetical protein ABPG75_004905 [Micractinium tetrahymenae]